MNLLNLTSQIAYCRSETMRRWFIQQESDLFRFRFNLERTKSSLESDAVSEFLRLNNLKFSPITTTELQSLHSELDAGTAVYGVNSNSVAFYKVCLVKW